VKKITVMLIDNVKIVKLNGVTVKKFNIISDDFAYTNSNTFATMLKKEPEEKLMKRFPHAFV